MSNETKTLEPHQQRVVDEKSQLDERREKLKAFFQTKTFEALDQGEKDRLITQQQIMLQYSDILGARIGAFEVAP